MTKKYENISLEEKVGQLLMFAFQGDSYNEQLDMQIRKLKVGGIIYFSRNIKNKEQVQRLNEKISRTPKYRLLLQLTKKEVLCKELLKECHHSQERWQ